MLKCQQLLAFKHLYAGKLALYVYIVSKLEKEAEVLYILYVKVVFERVERPHIDMISLLLGIFS